MTWRKLPVFVLSAVAALVALSALALWLARADSRDNSLLVDIEHRRDRADAGLEAIRHADFTPAESYFSGGYDSAAHWFRMRVRPPANGGPVALNISPNFLDRLDLYYVGVDGRWRHQLTGDSVTGQKRSWDGPGLGFVIHPRGEGSLYYLRVKTDSTVEVFLYARPLKNALVHATQRMAMHGLMFAMMALGVVLACLQLMYRPGVSNGLLVACSAGYLLFSLYMLGYPALANPQWSKPALASTTDLLYLATSLITLLFHRQFLLPMKPMKGAIMACDLLALVCLASFGLYFGGHVQLAFAVVSSVILLTAPTLVVMAWSASDGAQQPITSLRLFYSVFGAFVTVAMLFNLGLFQAVWFHLYSVEIFGIVNVLLVLALVVSRWWATERKLASSKERLNDAALRQEIKTRSAQLQDSLLHMLVHEVRNHLSVIQLAVRSAFDDAERAKANPMVRDLEALIQDCQSFSRLERGVWTPKPEKTDLVSTVLETLAELGDEDRFDVAYEASPVVTTDGAMLRAALGVLVSESCRRVSSQTLVRVAVRQDGPAAWAVTVSGQSQSVWPAPLSLLRTDRSMGTRASLSLAIAKGIVELIGGRLTVDQKGEDFRCAIILPILSASPSSKTMAT